MRKTLYCRVALFLLCMCVSAYPEKTWPSPLVFQIMSETDLPLTGVKAARPDTALIDGIFYVAYLQLSPLRTFKLLVLNRDLMPLNTMALFSGIGQPTDIRICNGPGKSFSYAVETAGFRTESPHTLNVARYELTAGAPLLMNSREEVAAAMPISIPGRLPGRGDELVDDPAPFVYKNQLYIVTRSWESAILTIRSFSEDLVQVETRELDLSDAFPGLYVSVNSLIEIDGRPFLIAGICDGPPIDRNSSSYIAAIQIDEDLRKAAGDPVVLSRTERYEGYVACARYEQGILYVGYDIQTNPGHSEHKGMIKAFDPKTNFSELASLQINTGRMIDNHFTFELMDQMLYVFYQTQENKIRVKALEVRNQPPTP